MTGRSTTEAVLSAESHITRESELHRLERRMYELDWRDPERAKIVAQYNAICDEMGIPSGDKE